MELISIHIPKTAGTSFMDTLRSVYGSQGVLRVDIPIPGERTPFASAPPPPDTLPDGTRVIHGHFRASDLRAKYGLPSGIPVLTWLRDPVERVISNYRYLHRALRSILREEERNINILSKMERTLMEYASADINRNRMSRFLDGLTLPEMLFAGIQEHMGEDMASLAALLGWRKYGTFRHNCAEGAMVTSAEREMREEIASLNSDDVSLYHEALHLRQLRRRDSSRPVCSS